MADPRPPASGGAFIAVGAIGGAAIGFALDQATAGFFIGLVLGIATAMLIWRAGR